MFTKRTILFQESNKKSSSQLISIVGFNLKQQASIQRLFTVQFISLFKK
jgi:hypothetical protein